MYMNSLALYAASIATTFVGVLFVVLFVAAGADTKLIVVSAFFVTASVIFTAAVKLHSEERDRAFRFLTENHNNKALLEAMGVIGRVRARNPSVSRDQATKLYLSVDPDHRAFIAQLFSVCNFFEEMAIGVKNRQINENIVKDFYAGMLFRTGTFVEFLLPIIRNDPRVPNHPFGEAKRPEVFENMEWLYRRWAADYKNTYDLNHKADPAL